MQQLGEPQHLPGFPQSPGATAATAAGASGALDLLVGRSPLHVERGEFELGFFWFDVPPPQPGPGTVFLPPSGEQARGAAPQSGFPSAVLPGVQQPLLLPPIPSMQYADLPPLPQPLAPQQHLLQLPLVQQEQQQSHPGSSSTGGREGGGRGRTGGHGGRGRRREEVRQAEAERRAEERRARNRVSQARFREQQKAKNEALLQEHAATEVELERTRQEQQELSTRASVLQKMLSVKEAAISSLGPAARGLEAPRSQQGAGQQAQQLQQASAAGGAQRLQRLPASPSLQQQGTAGMPPGALAGAVAGVTAGEAAVIGAPQPQRGSLLRKPSSSELAAIPLTSVVSEQMGKLGAQLTAQFAQLDLPATAHPDEAMAVAHATLATSPTKPRLPPLHHLSAGDGGTDLAGSSVDGDPAVKLAESPAAGAAVAHRGAHSGSQQDGRCSSQSLAALMQERPDLVRDVVDATPAEFVAQWQAHVKTIKDIVKAHDVTGSDDELERTLDILRKFSGTLNLALMLRPESAQALFATAADAPPGHWEAVADSLELTHAQRTMLQQMWHTYAARIMSARAEQVSALQAVQHAAGHDMGAALVSVPATTLGALTTRYLALFDAAGKLSTLRDAEFVAFMQLLGRTGAVLSPVQKAQLAAASYPLFPDVVQVTRLVVEGIEAAQQAMEGEGGGGGADLAALPAATAGAAGRAGAAGGAGTAAAAVAWHEQQP